MEISIDVGKHVVDEIQNIAQSENKDFDVISSKILELGLRVYQSSKSEDNDKKHDPNLCYKRKGKHLVYEFDLFKKQQHLLC